VLPLPIGAALHVFASVVLVGTLWRLLAYHAMASGNAHLQHVGAAMTTQY
jgi:hypothetical protein